MCGQGSITTWANCTGDGCLSSGEPTNQPPGLYSEEQPFVSPAQRPKTLAKPGETRPTGDKTSGSRVGDSHHPPLHPPPPNRGTALWAGLQMGASKEVCIPTISMWAHFGVFLIFLTMKHSS